MQQIQILGSGQKTGTMARFLFWIALLGLASYLSNSLFRIEGMVALQLTYALLLAILLLTPRR